MLDVAELHEGTLLVAWDFVRNRNKESGGESSSPLAAGTRISNPAKLPQLVEALRHSRTCGKDLSTRLQQQASLGMCGSVSRTDFLDRHAQRQALEYDGVARVSGRHVVRRGATAVAAVVAVSIPVCLIISA